MKFRFRYSLRTLMLLFMLVPLSCWLYVRHREFSHRAKRFHGLADMYQSDIWEEKWTEAEKKIHRPKFLEAKDYYRRLGEKYDRAALYPWLSVESDPPKSKNMQEAQDVTQRFY